MNMDQDQGRLDDKDWGEDDSEQSWYFDLPKGAWERQEQKNRELRERILKNVAEEPARKDVFSSRRSGEESGPGSAFREEPEADVKSRQSPGGTWQFNRGPASFDEALDPRRLDPASPEAAGDSDDDYSTEPSVESAPIPLLRRFRDEVAHEAPVAPTGPTGIFGHAGDEERAEDRPLSRWDETEETPAGTGFSIESTQSWAKSEPASQAGANPEGTDDSEAEEDSVGAFAWSDEPARDEAVRFAPGYDESSEAAAPAETSEPEAANERNDDFPVAPMAPVTPLPLRLRRRQEGEEDQEEVAAEIDSGEPMTRWDEMFGAKADDGGVLDSMKAWAAKEGDEKEDTPSRRWLADPDAEEAKSAVAIEQLPEPFGWESALQEEEQQRAPHDYGTSAEVAPRKKGLFGRLFRRKRGEGAVPEYVATAGDDWLPADEQPEPTTSLSEDGLPPLPKWMEDATRPENGDEDTTVRWAAVPGQVESEDGDWQPAPANSAGLESADSGTSDESEKMTAVAADDGGAWTPAAPVDESMASAMPEADPVSSSFQPAPFALSDQDEDFWNPEPIDSAALETVGGVLPEEAASQELGTGAETEDPVLPIASAMNDESESAVAMESAETTGLFDEAAGDDAVAMETSQEPVADVVGTALSEPVDEDEDPFAAFARAVDEAPENDPFAAFSLAVDNAAPGPAPAGEATTVDASNEHGSHAWEQETDLPASVLEAALDSSAELAVVPLAAEVADKDTFQAVAFDLDVEADDLIVDAAADEDPWAAVAALEAEEPASPVEPVSARSAAEIGPLPWEVEDSQAMHEEPSATPVADLPATTRELAWAALVSDPDGEGPIDSWASPDATGTDSAETSVPVMEAPVEPDRMIEGGDEAAPDRDDPWAGLESALTATSPSDMTETKAGPSAEGGQAPASMADESNDEKDDFIAAALGRRIAGPEARFAVADAPLDSWTQDREDEDDFVAAALREMPSEHEPPADDPWAAFVASRKDQEQGPDKAAAEPKFGEEPLPSSLERGIDEPGTEGPEAPPADAPDDPWAAIAIASGYDAEAPGGVAVYRGPEEEDDAHSIVGLFDIEAGAGESDEAGDEDQSVTGLSERVPEWAGEAKADDVILRAFEAHAQGETPEERAGHSAEDHAMPVEEAAAFNELLGDDAAELVAAGDESEPEPHSFSRLQGFAPQRPSGPQRPDPEAPWEPLSEDESDAWGGRGDGGFGNWSFSDDSAPIAVPRRNKTKTLVRELVETGLLALLVFLSVRASFQNFKVEGNSMQPTLEDGQFLIVNKLVYSEVDMDKLGDFLPFVDESGKRNVFHGPERGDIVVLEDPHKPGTDLIKRVIGLPGETVEIVDGAVYINDQLLEEPYIKTAWHDNRGKIEIPPGQYFVMGDNRDNSLDSRSPQVGLIQQDGIIGKAMLSYWPKSKFGLAPNEAGDISEEDGRPRLTAQRIGD